MLNSEKRRIYEEFRSWAIKRLEKIDHSTLDPKPKYLEFRDQDVLNIMGRGIRIEITQSTGLRSSSRLRNDTIHVKLAPTLSQEDRTASTYSLVRRSITKAMLPIIESHVISLNESNFNFELNRIKIRDQMTRWGSCSKRNKTINLNFRLLLAPQEIMDYVIIHELSHLKHENHSERFWNLVSTAVPEYKERRRWLRDNGNKIGTRESIVIPKEISDVSISLLPILVQ